MPKFFIPKPTVKKPTIKKPYRGGRCGCGQRTLGGRRRNRNLTMKRTSKK